MNLSHYLICVGFAVSPDGHVPSDDWDDWGSGEGSDSLARDGQLYTREKYLLKFLAG